MSNYIPTDSDFDTTLPTLDSTVQRKNKHFYAVLIIAVVLALAIVTTASVYCRKSETDSKSKTESQF